VLVFVELEVTIMGEAFDTTTSERKGLEFLFNQRSWFLKSIIQRNVSKAELIVNSQEVKKG